MIDARRCRLSARGIYPSPFSQFSNVRRTRICCCVFLCFYVLRGGGDVCLFDIDAWLGVFDACWLPGGGMSIYISVSLPFLALFISPCFPSIDALPADGFSITARCADAISRSGQVTFDNMLIPRPLKCTTPAPQFGAYF